MPQINSNIHSMMTANYVMRTERALGKSYEKLSTGLNINSASDDASGFSISEQLRMQMTGLDTGNRNIQDGIALLNIADGGLAEVGNILQRVRELAVQSSTATYGDADRQYITVEVDQLLAEMDRISNVTQYNRMPLLDGGNTNPWNSGEAYIHAGANDSMINDLVRIELDSVHSRDLFPAGLDLDTAANSQAAIGIIDAALDNLLALRSGVGASINRLDHSLTNQQNIRFNVAEAESLIRDTDFAKEASNLARLQILQQSSTAILAQANALPQNIISLLNQ